MSQLRAGELRYRTGKQNHYVAVHWGFAEVLPYKVTVLVETAERAEDIDLQRAETAKKRAEERLKQFGTTYDMESAREALERATARLEAAKREAADPFESHFTTNLKPTNGRMFVIAVDQIGTRLGSARALLSTAGTS
jgi:F-type H+-transporting ATPase subunit epsilon